MLAFARAPASYRLPVKIGRSKRDFVNLGLGSTKPFLSLNYAGDVFHFIFWWYLPQFVAPFIVKVASILFAPTPAENLALFGCFILVSSLSYAAAYFTQKWIEARGIALGNLIIARI